MTVALITSKRHQKVSATLHLKNCFTFNFLCFFRIFEEFWKNMCFVFKASKADSQEDYSLWTPWKIDKKIISELSIFTTGNAKNLRIFFIFLAIIKHEIKFGLSCFLESCSWLIKYIWNQKPANCIVWNKTYPTDTYGSKHTQKQYVNLLTIQNEN